MSSYQIETFNERGGIAALARSGNTDGGRAMTAPNPARAPSPVKELFDFLLWLDYVKADQAPDMPPWEQINKHAIASMLRKQLQAASAHLDTLDQKNGRNEAEAMTRIIPHCTKLIAELRGQP